MSNFNRLEGALGVQWIRSATKSKKDVENYRKLDTSQEVINLAIVFIINA